MWLIKYANGRAEDIKKCTSLLYPQSTTVQFAIPLSHHHRVPLSSLYSWATGTEYHSVHSTHEPVTEHHSVHPTHEPVTEYHSVHSTHEPVTEHHSVHSTHEPVTEYHSVHSTHEPVAMYHSVHSTHEPVAEYHSVHSTHEPYSKSTTQLVSWLVFWAQLTTRNYIRSTQSAVILSHIHREGTQAQFAVDTCHFHRVGYDAVRST